MKSGRWQSVGRFISAWVLGVLAYTGLGLVATERGVIETATAGALVVTAVALLFFVPVSLIARHVEKTRKRR